MGHRPSALIPLVALSALLGNGYHTATDRMRARMSLPRRMPKRVRVYQVNSGTKATERYRQRIDAGGIPEDQILRGVR